MNVFAWNRSLGFQRWAPQPVSGQAVRLQAAVRSAAKGGESRTEITEMTGPAPTIAAERPTMAVTCARSAFCAPAGSRGGGQPGRAERRISATCGLWLDVRDVALWRVFQSGEASGLGQPIVTKPIPVPVSAL